ncbi:hypothetical protein B296_00026204 [Ensete ventricosum]|uniref:Uncharacterized protein n=1 Tax=Ensete ventricosum TaxID=4639 RepID=A0A426XZK6_ENSVE|nr:hypothetical protein B296_00026204 [Ensete ventricosum]
MRISLQKDFVAIAAEGLRCHHGWVLAVEMLHCADATIIEAGKVNGSELAITNLVAWVKPVGGSAKLFICVDRGMEVVLEDEIDHGVGAGVAPTTTTTTKGDDSSPDGEEDMKDTDGGEEGYGEEEETTRGGQVITVKMIEGGKAHEGFARCRVVEVAGALGSAVAKGAFGKAGVRGGVPLDVEAMVEEGCKGDDHVFV